MKRILPLSLVLLLGACSEEGTVAAKEALGKAGEAAKSAVGSLSEKFKDIDFSKLSPEKLKEQGAELLGSVTSKLSEIKDSETAKSVAGNVSPLLEKAGGALKALGDKLPGRDQLKTKVQELIQKFSGDQGIMQHLKPILDKLSDILG